MQTQRALAAAMAPRLGQADVSGGTVTQADIDKAVADSLRASLPALAATAADPAVSGATDVQAALVAAALDLVATQLTLDATEALAAVAAAKLAQAAVPTTPVDSAVLRALSYTDANNWSYRAMAATAADNTPDAGGLVHFYDIHKQATAGVVSSWGLSTLEARKGDLHWNGSAWAGCALGQRSSQAPRDAQGRSVYNYCDGDEKGVSTRTVTDISGQTMASVITTNIRTFPGEDSGAPYASWGPVNLSVLGNTTFPAGSQLFYQQTTPTENAYAYDVTNPVSAWDTSVAAGGDARNNATLACNQAYLGSLLSRQTATLEELVATNLGRPCTVNPQTDASGSSLNPNTWWTGSSASIGTVSGANALPAGTGSFYSTAASLRVSFAASGNAVTYYRCYVRASNSSNRNRNCSSIGSGTYAIQTLGDARVMTFSGLPALAQRLNFSRVFVQRGGVVYFGFRGQDNLTRSTLRLNLPAANALFGTLGIATIVP